MVVYTIGHSTRTAAEFVALLREHGIQRLVDVRRFPGSQRYPHFNRDALAGLLADAGIAYRHAEELGGRRQAHADSPNTAWQNAGFRGYADYMATPAFGAAIASLLREAAQERTAVMCAEAVPWRCHRNLLADALLTQNCAVAHILGPALSQNHALNPTARVRGDGSLWYPDNGAQRNLL